MPRIDLAALPEITGTGYPQRLAQAVAGRSRKALGDAAGLTQFGVNLVTLAAGAASSLRHWHENEDEFLWMLEGEAVLVEDGGETVLRAGDAAGWKAGVANGHQLVNRSAAPARFLVVGTRAARETCRYADVDLLYRRDGEAERFTRRDGSPPD